MPESKVFKFRHFEVQHDRCGMKVNTDGVVLGAYVDVSKATNILDIGTGSGFIALMLAQRCEAKIFAVEIEENAFLQAEENFNNSIWNERLNINHIDFQSYARETVQKFNLIVSNPPYFRPLNIQKGNNTQLPDPLRATARFFDALPFSELTEGVSHILDDKGWFYVIIPHDAIAEFTALAGRQGLYLREKLDISSMKEKMITRNILKFGKTIGPVDTQELILHEANGSLTESFKTLTANFYFH